MSETWMGAADFTSCPGTARRIRAVSVKLMVVSVTLSNVTTTELPLTDFTVPITLAGVCAELSANKLQTTKAITTQGCNDDFVNRDKCISTLINSNTYVARQGVKNCQTRVKVVGGERAIMSV